MCIRDSHMRVPAIAGAAVFVALMAYFALVLVPEYHEIIAAGGAAGEALAEQLSLIHIFPWSWARHC